MIGVPSSQTASGLSLMVRVIAAVAAGASLLAGASLPAGASVAGASVAGAAVVSLLPPLSLPHAAATRAVPASSATILAPLGVLLTYLTSWVVWFGRATRAAGAARRLGCARPARLAYPWEPPGTGPAFDHRLSTSLTSP